MSLSYLVLFHKSLPYNTQVLTEEEQKSFIYCAINESIPKHVPHWASNQLLIECNTMAYYNPLYHMNKLSYCSMFFHLVRQPDLIQTPYIGFGQYDQQIDPITYREAITLLNKTPNALCGAFPLTGKKICELITLQGWDNLLIQPLNKVFPQSPITFNELMRHPVFGMNTFILPKSIFMEMMRFVEIYVFKNLMIMTKYDTTHTSICLSYVFGLYLAYCIHQGKFSDVFTYNVSYVLEQNEPDVSQPYQIKQDWLEEMDHTMHIKHAKKWITPALPLLEESIIAKGKKVWFMSFSSPGYEKVLERIQKEAAEFGLFDKIKGYQQKDLQHSEFWLAHKEYVKQPNFGNWLWKPFLVLETLERMSYDDVLVYTDVGSVISTSGQDRFKQYLYIIRQSPFGMLFFQSTNKEKMCTKMDVFHQMNMRHPRIMDTPQYNSKAFIIRKNEYSMKFVKEWYELSSKHYSWIDDSPSVMTNDPVFQSHKGEHALFSILAKRHGTEMLPDETTPIRSGFPILYQGM
jgi:hypothetical protein